MTCTAAVAALAAVGCTSGGLTGGGLGRIGSGVGAPSVGGRQVTATPNPAYVVPYDGAAAGMDHGGSGMDHGGSSGGGAAAGGHAHSMPARLNHEPSAAQQAAAKRLIADTRAAARKNGQTSVAALRSQGYISIGDEMTGVTHYVKPSYHYDQYELDPNHIEAFAYKGGRVVAAMYILSNGKTQADIPDVAGTWTMWHDHTLPFQSNNQYTDAYYRLGGLAIRQTAPMLHVWLEKNPCGPFAGTDTGNMTGSCNRNIE